MYRYSYFKYRNADKSNGNKSKLLSEFWVAKICLSSSAFFAESLYFFTMYGTIEESHGVARRAFEATLRPSGSVTHPGVIFQNYHPSWKSWHIIKKALDIRLIQAISQKIRSYLYNIRVFFYVLPFRSMGALEWMGRCKLQIVYK